MENRYNLRDRSHSEGHVECKFCEPPTPLALKKKKKEREAENEAVAVAVAASTSDVSSRETSPSVPLSSISNISTMTDLTPAVASVTGSLEGYLFQLKELLDELKDISTVNSQNLHQSLTELKELRFTIVKSNAELKQLLEADYPAAKEDVVKEALENSKSKMCSIKKTLSERESEMLREEDAKQHARDKQKAEENKGRLFAFNAMLDEIKTISSKLVDSYDISEDDDSLTAENVMNRKEKKSKYASDVQRVRQLYDRLLGYSDVTFKDKDEVLQNQQTKLESLEWMKEKFESKLLKDLEEFDLTDQKMKLAVQAKTDIGKFSGSLEKGTDFYTFKSKFQKAYAKFPKSIVIERLVNNHLDGRAKESVGTLDDIEAIWERLQNNFGNTEEMLQFQFKKINLLGHISLQKTFALKKHYLQKLVNTMQDVLDLATEHSLLGELHYGNQLNKIAKLMEDCAEGKWWKIVAKENVEKTRRWERMLQFLNELLKVVQVRAAEAEVVVPKKKDDSKIISGGDGSFVAAEVCNLCGDRHPNSNSAFVQCKKFLDLDIKERSTFVRSKRYCVQCLDGTSKWDDPQHKCSVVWICKHQQHNKFKKKLHFLLCAKHADDPANKELYEEFKKEVLKADWQKKLHASVYCTLGSKLTPDSFAIEPTEFQDCIDPRNDGAPAYILQQIPLFGYLFNAMFDSGCRNTVFRDQAVDLIPDDHKENTQKGPIVIGGVGAQNVVSTKGEYAVKLPIHDGSLVKFRGASLEVVTGTMPPYPVGEAFKSIAEDYEAQGGDISDLPAVPETVGGDTDFLIGIQYNYFQPRMIHIMTTGLAIYLSPFVGVDGARGCIGGPHDVFQQCERQFFEHHGTNYVEFRAFLQQQLLLFNNGIRVCVDVDELPIDRSFLVNPMVVKIESPKPKPVALLATTKFEDAENAGSVIEYRCQTCRGCQSCKKGEFTEKISVREEYEQQLIEDSVTVDLKNKQAIGYLPFTANPDEKLVSNPEVAMKVYKQQTKMLDKKDRLKKAIIESEAALQEAGFVDWVSNLPADVQDSISKAAVQYMLPWRCVENVNSLSTPARLVFDATMVTSSGQSLNDIVAKGLNSLNSMLGIFLQFRIWKSALTTDAKKLYNHVKLRSEHWRFQLYFWHNSLDPSLEPLKKAILTVIYGVKSSGNQATHALRQLADMLQDQYPEAALAIRELTYMDDTAGGTMDDTKIDSLAADIDELLAAGGFSTKGFTISGRKPPPSLSKDGVSVNVLGSKWLSEEDKIQLNVGPLNFYKKHRGRKEENAESSVVPKKLTKRICAGKVGEMFDLTGLALPITAAFKLDLHELHSVYGWDDKLSEADRNLWIEHFDTMNNLNSVVWGRGVLPPDAVNHDIELIGAGDASEKLACAACYIRFERVDGSYSCRLLMSKSKVIPDGMTIPRAELLAMVLNTHVVEIVKRALKHHNIVKTINVLDSEISLYWIASQTKPLKPWVRNRVIEILRFTNVSDWFHVKSDDNPADLPTRKGAKLVDIDDKSEWINGKPWMHAPLDALYGTVLNDVDAVKLRTEQVVEMKKEQMKVGTDLCNTGVPLVSPDVQTSSLDSAHTANPESNVTSIVRERLKFSRYLIDPNRFRFTKVVRVLAIIIATARKWIGRIRRVLTAFPLVNNRVKNIPSMQNKVEKFQLDRQVKVLSATDVFKAPISAFITEESTVNKPQMKTGLEGDDRCIVLSDAEVQDALDYLFRKGTEELKSFNHPKQYENISVEKDGILYYTGRLCVEDISLEGNDGNNITQKMLDLTKETFVVPIIDKNSPIAYSIVNDVHWYHISVKHAGVESTIRALMTIVHIINVRQLVKMFKKNCKRCRYILKRTLDIMMAQGSKDQLHVAPPFYVTQVDLCGSFSSYSTHHKRTTVKVWIVAFVCSTTGMTSLKIMQGYDTAQFILAFTRFACELGFPKKLLIDAGSQLVSGCEKAVLNMSDVKGQLNREYGIEFDTAPVGGHNFHGKVERKIRTVRDSLERSVHKARLSVLEWETLCAEISNSINNLPVAIGNETEDLESLDLITPNRLRLGRNNSRSPVGLLEITGKVDRLLTLKTEVFQSWWETWLVSAPPKLVPQPKWFKGDENLKVGDVVLFDKAEGSLVGEYHYGIVEETFASKDDHVRSVKLRYRNAEEATGFRTTKRAVRGLVVIHRVDEIDVMEELGNAAVEATGYYLCTEGILKDYGEDMKNEGVGEGPG